MGIWNRYRNAVQYQKFCALLAAGKHSQAVDLFPYLGLQNGQKQIAMAQFGNALMNLHKYGQAISVYNETIESELNWGGRKRKSNSHYLVAYCKYFAELSNSHLENRKFEGWIDRVTYLDCLPASERIKKYYLPPPRPPV